MAFWGVYLQNLLKSFSLSISMATTQPASLSPSTATAWLVSLLPLSPSPQGRCVNQTAIGWHVLLYEALQRLPSGLSKTQSLAHGRESNGGPMLSSGTTVLCLGTLRSHEPPSGFSNMLSSCLPRGFTRDFSAWRCLPCHTSHPNHSTHALLPGHRHRRAARTPASAVPWVLPHCSNSVTHVIFSLNNSLWSKIN